MRADLIADGRIAEVTNVTDRFVIDLPLPFAWLVIEKATHFVWVWLGRA